jgi:hypothetical protein
MDVSVRLRTTLSFEGFDVEDDESINDIQDIIYNEMSADEIICLAQSQGHSINIDVDVD